MSNGSGRMRARRSDPLSPQKTMKPKPVARRPGAPKPRFGQRHQARPPRAPEMGRQHGRRDPTSAQKNDRAHIYARLAAGKPSSGLAPVAGIYVSGDVLCVV